MNNRGEQLTPDPEANPDYGSSDAKESYRRNLENQLAQVRKSDRQKPPPDPEITGLIDRLKKKQKDKGEPKQPSFLE